MAKCRRDALTQCLSEINEAFAILYSQALNKRIKGFHSRVATFSHFNDKPGNCIW
jgi:hypothetical protein